MELNEIKKDLYRTKAVAKLQYYDGTVGKLVYNVELFGVAHQFPIYVFEKEPVVTKTITTDIDEYVVGKSSGVKMADDLKGANFEVEVKGSSLIRWITKALEKDEIICLSQN